MFNVRGHDKTEETFNHRDEATHFIKEYLNQWMIEGDRITWGWVETPFNGDYDTVDPKDLTPNHAQVVTVTGEPVDAYASIVEVK